MSQFLLELKYVGFLFLWLLIVLPVFDSFHYWLFKINHREIQSYRYIDWFIAFFKALKQRAANPSSMGDAIIKKLLMFFALVAFVFAFAMLPIIDTHDAESTFYAQDFGSKVFSPLLVLIFLLFGEFLVFLLGFTVGKPLVAQVSVEKFISRMSILMIYLASMVGLPHVYNASTLLDAASFQSQSTSQMIPAWGIFINPIGFVCFFITTLFYLRLWHEEEYPKAYVMPSSLQGELLGTDLLTYRVIRSIKYLVVYGLLVTLFLGGSHFLESQIHPFVGAGLFTAKIFAASLLALFVYGYMPKVIPLKSYRVFMIRFLPVLGISFPLAVWLLGFLIER